MTTLRASLLIAPMAGFSGVMLADSYSDTVELFKKAGASPWYFENSYGYAVFPTIGRNSARETSSSARG